MRACVIAVMHVRACVIVVLKVRACVRSSTQACTRAPVCAHVLANTCMSSLASGAGGAAARGRVPRGVQGWRARAAAAFIWWPRRFDARRLGKYPRNSKPRNAAQRTTRCRRKLNAGGGARKNCNTVPTDLSNNAVPNGTINTQSECWLFDKNKARSKFGLLNSCRACVKQIVFASLLQCVVGGGASLSFCVGERRALARKILQYTRT